MLKTMLSFFLYVYTCILKSNTHTLCFHRTLQQHCVFYITMHISVRLGIEEYWGKGVRINFFYVAFAIMEADASFKHFNHNNRFSEKQ